jgi:hypothetical protein
MPDKLPTQQGDVNHGPAIGAVAGHHNLRDYVVDPDETRLRVTNVNTSINQFDVTPGEAFVFVDQIEAGSSGEIIQNVLIPVEVSGRSGVNFATSGTNYVHLLTNYASQNDDPEIDVTGSETHTREDSLLIATANSDTGETDHLNRDPTGRYAALSVLDRLILLGEVEWPDGTVTSGAPLTTDSELNKKNERYDADPSTGYQDPPPGVVYRAKNASTADEVADGGSTPGSTIDGPINLINTQYDTDGDGVVDQAETAENAQNVNDRDLNQIRYETAAKSPDTVLPRTEVRDGVPSGTVVPVGGETFKLWCIGVCDANGNSLPSLVARVIAEGGATLYENDYKNHKGDYTNANPIGSASNVGHVTIEAHHSEGSPVEVNVVAGYTIE